MLSCVSKTRIRSRAALTLGDVQHGQQENHRQNDHEQPNEGQGRPQVIMPMIAGAASPAPTAMQTLGSAGGGVASPAGGPQDLTPDIESLRQAADPLMQWFASHPALGAGGQALQSLLKQTLQQLVQSSGVQTNSAAALPMGGQ